MSTSNRLRFEMMHWLSALEKLGFRKKDAKKAEPFLTLPCSLTIEYWIPFLRVTQTMKVNQRNALI